jgi:hypothetical protein
MKYKEFNILYELIPITYIRYLVQIIGHTLRNGTVWMVCNVLLISFLQGCMCYNSIWYGY